jgi:hypothetical protein
MKTEVTKTEELEPLPAEVRMELAGKVANVESHGDEDDFKRVLEACLRHDDTMLITLAYIAEQRRAKGIVEASTHVRGLRWRRLADRVRPVLEKWTKDAKLGKTAALIPRSNPSAESELSRGLKSLFKE